MSKEPQLFGIKPSNQLMIKDLEKRQQEIELKEKELQSREQYIGVQQAQIHQMQQQLDSALVGIVRNTLLQCYNWAIDEELKFSDSRLETETLMNRAIQHYAKLEKDVETLAETRKAEALERIRIANEKAEQERKEKEEKPAE